GGGAPAMEIAGPRRGTASLLRIRRRAAQGSGRGAGVTCNAPPVGDHARKASADDALIERLRARDTAALEALMARHTDRVYRVAFGLARDHAEAQEVVQDVFLTLFRKIHMFEGRAALGPWLYRVAANAPLIKLGGKRVDSGASLEDCLPSFLGDGHR